jgi:hypothetical protein
VIAGSVKNVRQRASPDGRDALRLETLLRLARGPERGPKKSDKTDYEKRRSRITSVTEIPPRSIDPMLSVLLQHRFHENNFTNECNIITDPV